MNFIKLMKQLFILKEVLIKQYVFGTLILGSASKLYMAILTGLAVSHILLMELKLLQVYNVITIILFIY